ncbi:MAG: neutral/alkaline non-lysosomal ceramidase N-terminal domain-containing protein [Gemmatimonadetes bacterium]|nr:neutral/alkaline non-lysosomal ceramidase N-terminal domain-containing protein [Gemmatimonadota bacterium]
MSRRLVRGATPIGLLNWFAIHTTNMGKQSTRISGDNKGWASHVLEQKHGPAFVAGFANGCAGDVSGNFIQGMPGFDSVEGTNFQQQRDRMIAAGNAQAMLAQSLLDRGGATLTGPVTAMEYRVNLPCAPVRRGARPLHVRGQRRGRRPGRPPRGSPCSTSPLPRTPRSVMSPRGPCCRRSSSRSTGCWRR